MVDTVARELLRARSAQNEITLKTSVHNLDNNFTVREADDQAVFGRVVFVLGLSDKALAGIVVGLAGTAALVLHLVAAACRISGRTDDLKNDCRVPEVGAVLDQLGLPKIHESAICASEITLIRSILQRPGNHERTHDCNR